MYIGTSGWHYDDWRNLFYPPTVKGYNELKYYSGFFNTVENNSSFYRIPGESTYNTWYKSVPQNFKFSIKLNKLITHNYKLLLTKDVQTKVSYILSTTQILREKLGAIVIQLPPSFKLDIPRLKAFADYFTKEVNIQTYKFDIAIEFRDKQWFFPEVYKILEKYNIAMVAAQSLKYPGERQITADFLYFRMHGPKELFASKYSKEELKELANYIEENSKQVKRVYVYFNNDFYGYALDNATTLSKLLSKDSI